MARLQLVGRGLLWRQAGRLDSCIESRKFSSSAKQNGASTLLLPSPPPTASPELLSLFTKLRAKVFMPAFLKTPQRRLVFRRQHRAMLQNDPIKLSFGEEQFTLEPIDRCKDIPDGWKSVKQAIEFIAQEADKSDGANMDFKFWYVELLKNFRKTSKQWKQFQQEYILKRACELGHLDAAIETVRLGEETGFKLDDIRLARELFWGCRSLAYGEFGHADPAAALEFAERLARLCDEFTLKNPNIVAQPDCIAVLLDIAVLTDREKTKVYADRLITNLKREVGSDIDPFALKLQQSGLVISAADYELARWSPVYHAIESASQLLKDDMPHAEEAKVQLQIVKKKLSDARDIIEQAGTASASARRRGYIWTKALGE